MAEVKPLEIGCNASRCKPSVPKEHRRHSFISPTGSLPGLGGSCRACGGLGLVDWERTRSMDPGDLPGITAEIRKQLLPDNYWAEPLPERIFRNARRHDTTSLQASLERRLRSALVVNHAREGRQTSWGTTSGATIAHCAQHGTGTCCRRCVEKWFGIPMRQDLSATQFDFLLALAWDYEVRRLEEVGGG